MFNSLQVDPESISLYPGEETKIQLNMTVPYLCSYPKNDGCSFMRIELYMQNNRKPMCNLQNKMVGASSKSIVDFSDSNCFSKVHALYEGDNMTQLQFATFNIEAATTSLFTGKKYTILANFKAMEVRDHRIWDDYRPVPLKVIFFLFICVVLIKLGTNLYLFVAGYYIFYLIIKSFDSPY